MNIVVCVKRVPETTTRVRIADDGRSLDRTGVQFVLNPYDEYAMEEALRIRERLGAGAVTAVTVGPADSVEVLRECLALGADRAIHLKVGEERDAFGTATALADCLRDLPHDLVFFGKQAVDDDGAQVGPLTAALLGMPCVTVVTKLDIAGGRASARREVEGGHQEVEFPLPAVVTAQKGLNDPRFKSLKGIMAAKKKTIEERPAAAAEPGLRVERMEYPPPRPAGRIVGKGPEAAAELVRLLREEAKVI